MDNLSNEINKDPEYFGIFLDSILQLWTKKELFDVQIVATFNNMNQEKFHAHKVVLASGSAYLASHINEITKKKYGGQSNTDVLELDLRSHEAADFPIILNYLYTGNVKCTIKNVISLFHYSETFELNSLRPVVIEFMKSHVTCYTWLKFWRFSVTHNASELVEKCEDFCTENFEDTLNKNLHELEPKEFIKIVKESNMNTEKERLTAFKYIIDWIKNNEEERLQFLYELTKWNTFLKNYVIAHLYNNQRSKLKEYLRNLTFNKMREFCLNRDFDQKIVYTCIKEWIYLYEGQRAQNFEELLRINLTNWKNQNIDIEFLKMEGSTEKLIYENQNVKTLLYSIVGPFTFP